MKLYRAKIPVIAEQTLRILVDEDDILIDAEHRAEAVKDLVAIMEEYLNRDNDFRTAIKDHMADHNIPYDQYGKVRSKLAEELNHAVGDDVERYLTRQIIENLLISPNVDEVFSEDKELHKKIIGVFREHHVDEGDIRTEAMEKIKNVAEGTVEYEIALQHAMREVRKRRGLQDPDRRSGRREN